MKRLSILTLALVLLLGQWGSLDHAYHDHSSGETCDYCISAKALDQAVTIPLSFTTTQSPALALDSTDTTSVKPIAIRHYPVRGPPHFI